MAIAHALISEGVTKGDRVAILMRNLPEWPAAFFGAVLAGAIDKPHGLRECVIVDDEGYVWVPGVALKPE